MSDNLQAMRARIALDDLMGHYVKLMLSFLALFALLTNEHQVGMREENLVRLQPL